MNKLKENEYWKIVECNQCGKSFSVLKSHIKRGGGKFCGKSCLATYRNTHNNPTKCPIVRDKISKNHADFSGKNNPMFGKRGNLAPSYIDGRNSLVGETYRKIALIYLEHRCTICGEDDLSKLQVHHINHDRSDNGVENLMFACSKCHNNILHSRNRDDLGRFIKGDDV